LKIFEKDYNFRVLNFSKGTIKNNPVSQPSITTSLMDRLQALDEVEKNILTCLSSAGQALQELSKDKPSIKQMDQHTANFLKTLNHVELEMGKHINYLTQVSTGQAHEGSSYASQKVLQMAWHRSEHARSKVIEMDRMKPAATSSSSSAGNNIGGFISTMGGGGGLQRQFSVPTNTSRNPSTPGTPISNPMSVPPQQQQQQFKQEPN